MNADTLNEKNPVVNEFPVPNLKKSVLGLLGTSIPTGMTAVESLRLIGLDWPVEVRNSAFPDGKGGYKEDFSEQCIVRADLNVKFGTVGKRFQPIQNVETAEFVDTLCARAGARVVSGGCLGLGQQIFFLCYLPKPIVLPEDSSPIERFFLISNAHDGSSALRVDLAPLRVEDGSVLNFPVIGKDNISVRHSANNKNRMEEAVKASHLIYQAYFKFESIASKLAHTEFFVSDFIKLASDLLSKAKNTRSMNNREGLVDAFKAEFKDDGWHAWRALTAVAAWVDYDRATRQVDGVSPKDLRISSVFWNSGFLVKSRAFEALSHKVNL